MSLCMAALSRATKSRRPRLRLHTDRSTAAAHHLKWGECHIRRSRYHGTRKMKWTAKPLADRSHSGNSSGAAVGGRRFFICSSLSKMASLSLSDSHVSLIPNACLASVLNLYRELTSNITVLLSDCCRSISMIVSYFVSSVSALSAIACMLGLAW